ncbi:MAG TPA: DUF4160 domain-containing protein [Clostridiales bacterium]|nr:DUF4160 domain-containing protein [Clostridiales bacterium]HQP69320.1 DUF4160 domain-containing protein [Clostridiales bacterium]
MPVISRFYGIIIKMYFNEHGIPHFHAIYNEYNGVFSISDLIMIEGDLPSKAQTLVKEWAFKYKDELEKMWATKDIITLPGLE